MSVRCRLEIGRGHRALKTDHAVDDRRSGVGHRIHGYLEIRVRPGLQRKRRQVGVDEQRLEILEFGSRPDRHTGVLRSVADLVPRVGRVLADVGDRELSEATALKRSDVGMRVIAVVEDHLPAHLRAGSRTFFGVGGGARVGDDVSGVVHRSRRRSIDRRRRGVVPRDDAQLRAAVGESVAVVDRQFGLVNALRVVLVDHGLGRGRRVAQVPQVGQRVAVRVARSGAVERHRQRGGSAGR